MNKNNKIGITYWIIAIVFIPIGAFIILIKTNAVSLSKGIFYLITSLIFYQLLLRLMIISEGNIFIQQPILVLFFSYIVFISKWQYKIGFKKDIWTEKCIRNWNKLLFLGNILIVLTILSFVINCFLFLLKVFLGI